MKDRWLINILSFNPWTIASNAWANWKNLASIRKLSRSPTFGHDLVSCDLQLHHPQSPTWVLPSGVSETSGVLCGISSPTVSKPENWVTSIFERAPLFWVQVSADREMCDLQGALKLLYRDLCLEKGKLTNLSGCKELLLYCCKLVVFKARLHWLLKSKGVTEQLFCTPCEGKNRVQ